MYELYSIGRKPQSHTSEPQIEEMSILVPIKGPYGEGVKCKEVEMKLIDTPGLADTNAYKSDEDHFSRTCE